MGRTAGLSDKMKAFCQEWVLSSNKRSAAKAAGYKGKPEVLTAQANRLMNLKHVQDYIALLQKDIRQTYSTKIEDMVQAACAIAYFDPRKVIDENTGLYKKMEDIDPGTRAAISEIELNAAGKIVHLKIAPKLPAIELVMRYGGAFEADNKQKQPKTAPLAGEDVDKLLNAIRANAGKK